MIRPLAGLVGAVCVVGSVAAPPLVAVVAVALAFGIGLGLALSPRGPRLK